MTYEEYIKKNEELTLEEIENKRVFNSDTFHPKIIK